MSKGYRPNDKNRPDVTVIEQEVDSGTIVDTNKICWQFPLQEKTAYAAEIPIESSVTGSIHENRILIRGNSRALGFAPDNKASEIIQAIAEKRVKLLGKVLSVDESNTWVEICLK